MKEDWNLELSEYLKLGEQNKVEKTKSWQTAIGLQDVDRLKHSKYLIETAKEHIEGNINLNEAKQRINNYYESINKRNIEENTEEADKVAVHITEILLDNSFDFNPIELINIHKKLFSEVYNHAGIIRNYNFIKKEWILNNDRLHMAHLKILWLH